MIERFMNKIEPIPWTGCWIWTAGINKAGYGIFAVNRKSQLAHRISYILYKGKIPLGKFVCHSCDNPTCVNPDHLWLGTAKDNAVDRMVKGRNADQRGYKSALAKWELKTVQAMREAKGSLNELTKQYGISKSQISKIRSGKCWSGL